MLFNSYEFLFIFLPISLVIYFLFNFAKFIRVGKLWLIVSSLFFYSWWNPAYLPIIVISILVNYSIASYIEKYKNDNGRKSKAILILGVFLNVLLLIYFKYADFLIGNANNFLITH